MNEKNGFSGVQLFTVFLGGALAGAVAALLLAPRAGRETRGQITSRLKEGRDCTKRIPEAVKDASGAAKEVFTKAMDG